MSIKPEFANKIFDGRKLFEFRKALFRDPSIKTIVVYASSPVQKVIGEFEIDDILQSNPRNIWELTKEQSGISSEYFFSYFSGRNIAYAIKVKNVRRYDKPLSLKENFNVHPPQSYLYLK